MSDSSPENSGLFFCLMFKIESLGFNIALRYLIFLTTEAQSFFNGIERWFLV